MKNKQFIESFEKISPSQKQKEKMLEAILNKETKRYSFRIWNLGLATMCMVCCCMIMNGYFKENTLLEPAQPHLRIASEEPNDFCFQNICYQEIGKIEKQEDWVYVDTILEDGKQTDIYQSKEENVLILKKDNSYLMYQKKE